MIFIAPFVFILFESKFKYFNVQFSFRASDRAYPPTVSIELPYMFNDSMFIQFANNEAIASAPESEILLYEKSILRIISPNSDKQSERIIISLSSRREVKLYLSFPLKTMSKNSAAGNYLSNSLNNDLFG